MNTILFSICVLSFCVSYFILLKHNIHIFQINFYKVKPQIKWICSNIKNILIPSLMSAVAGVCLIFNNSYFMILYAILVLLSGLISVEKNVKKPIVYTLRVKRMIITAYILNILIGVATYFLTKSFNITLIILAYLNVFVPFLMLFANLINLPINRVINKKYINEAKKKIDSMKNLIVIGVTGSYGKTSVKNFLYKCLSEKYNVLITPENFNTTLGVVKTIRENLNATHEIFVCEMGATHVNDIKEICDIVHPKYGVITSIGPQHLESFCSIENVIKTKFELVDSLPDDGIAFLNFDNEYIKNQGTNKNVVTYGVENVDNMYNAYDLKADESGITFKVNEKDGNIQEFKSKVIGKHNIENMVGAIAVANMLGIPLSKLVKRIRQIEPVKHRLEVIKRGEDIIIDDAYNSNPVGSKSALDTLSSFDGIKILVTPGMIELGNKEYECNFEFGKYVYGKCDYVVLIGEKQTKPIYDGISSTKFDKDKIFVVDTLKEGLNLVDSLKVGGKRKVILLENDLPDNY